MARAKGIPALELYRLAQKKKRKLVLCGHSLGGAVSIREFFYTACLPVHASSPVYPKSESWLLFAGSSVGNSSHIEGHRIYSERK